MCYMEISSHYLPYEKKTLIVLTNNECAKILFVFGRELVEREQIKIDKEHLDKRAADPSFVFPPDSDEAKAHIRKELFAKLSRKLLRLLKGEAHELILCAPEVNKNELVEAMHADVKKALKELVPKNLASLPLDHVVRILQETRAD